MATLDEKYRIHNKQKSNKSLLIYVFIFVICIFSSTFSRYLNSVRGTFGMELANWSIIVNDEIITPQTTTINNKIPLIVTENGSNDGRIKPGQKGYFDIIINPENTEVSLNYKIVIDVSELPSNIKLIKYSINDSNEKINMPNNKTIEGNIYLDGKSSLDGIDKKKYRIFWEWPEDDVKVENIQNEYKVKANLQIKQIVN